MARSYRNHILIPAVLLTFVLQGCTAYQKNTVTGSKNQWYRISDSGREAYANSYMWNLDLQNTEITIADEIDGAKVISLGGYRGTGAAEAFTILPDAPVSDYYVSGLPDPQDYSTDITWQDLVFTVHIGKNVKDVVRCASAEYIGMPAENRIDFYHPVCYFECDPDNPYLYARDGVLYSRKDDTTFDELKYLTPTGVTGPVYADLPLSAKLTGTYVAYGEEDMSVAEVFCTEDTIWMNVGSYMNDSLYVYYAAELVPETPLSDTESTEIRTKVRAFSSFSKAGQWWDEAPEGYILYVQEDSLRLEHISNGLPIFDFETLQKNAEAPRQFPADPEELTPLLIKDDQIRTLFPEHLLVKSVFSVENIRVKILCDGTMTVIRDGEMPEIYRGICRWTLNGDIVYSLTRLGYAKQPYTGRLQYDRQNQTLSAEAGCDPFIPDGEESAVLIPVN